MKISKIILFIVPLLFAPVLDADAQLFSKIFQKSTKTVAKKTAVKGAKEVAEDIATKAIVKELGQASVAKSSKKILLESTSEASEKIFKRTLANNIDNVLIIRFKENADELSVAIGHNIFRNTLKESTQELSTTQVKHLINKNLNKAFVEVHQKRIIKEYIQDTYRKQISELIGFRAAKEWCEKIAVEGFEKKSQQLLLDISRNKTLRNAITKNPNLLKSYDRVIDSQFRNDVSILRYMDNGAGKLYKKGISAINKYGDGSNLLFRDNNGITEIFDSKTSKTLGNIRPDKSGRYIIEVPENGDRTLLNLYPKSNCTYKCGDNTWITDAKGRVVKVHYKTKSVTDTKNVRVKGMDTSMGTYKNIYNTDGHIVGDAPSHMPDDDGGHLIPLESGGSSDLINYIPQDKTCNRKGLWRESEKIAAKSTRNGKLVDCTIDIKYPNKTSLRPSGMRRTQVVDGRYQSVKVNGKTILLDGTTEIKNPYNYNHTLRENVKI